jgi:cardiolipin synthase
MRATKATIIVLAGSLAIGGCTITNGIYDGAIGTFYSAPKREEYRKFRPDFAVQDPQFLRSLIGVGAEVTAGNSATILVNGDRIFPAMTEDIRHAKVSVNLETFMYEDDEAGRQFADAMIEAARRGVQVRLLTDGWGARLGKLKDELQAAGVQCARYRPLHFYSLRRPGIRTHRKLLIVDGRIGYTGGLGIDKRWLGDARDANEWRDTQVRVTGPVVAQMQAIFSENWTFTTGKILTGDAFYPALEPTGAMRAQAIKSSKGDASSLPKMMYFLAIKSARRYIHIQNAYFIPDDQVRKVLIRAVKRGVDVQVMVPGEFNDLALIRQASRAHYGELLEGGVKIFEYVPTMMHSKTLVVDGIFSTIGSINFDARSMGVNCEESLSVYDTGFAAEMEAMFQHDKQRCEEIRYEDWKRRGLRHRFAEFFAWILEPYY